MNYSSYLNHWSSEMYHLIHIFCRAQHYLQVKISKITKFTFELKIISNLGGVCYLMKIPVDNSCSPFTFDFNDKAEKITRLASIVGWYLRFWSKNESRLIRPVARYCYLRFAVHTASRSVPWFAAVTGFAFLIASISPDRRAGLNLGARGRLSSLRFQSISTRISSYSLTHPAFFGNSSPPNVLRSQ